MIPMCLQKSELKKVFCILFVLVSLHYAQVSSATLKENLTFSMGMGLAWGRAEELVYPVSGLQYSNQNKYLSQLVWDIHTVPLLEMEMKWKIGSFFETNIALDLAPPGWKTGNMYDYDWFFTDKDWSHRSTHNLTLSRGIRGDISGDFRLVDTGTFSFHAGIGYHLDSWAWIDVMQDSVYSSLSDNASTIPRPFENQDGFRNQIKNNINQSSIDYEVNHHAFLVMMKFRFRRAVFFSEITGRIGPALVESIDLHKLRDDGRGGRGIQFKDSIFGFPWVDATVDFGFRTSEVLSLILRGEIAWLGEIRGDVDMYTRDDVFLGTASDQSGHGFLRGGLSFLVSWTPQFSQ